MRKEYEINDFSLRKNSYSSKLKKQISINLDESNIEYFKELSAETGVPYQTLINNFLSYCSEKKLRPQNVWK